MYLIPRGFKSFPSYFLSKVFIHIIAWLKLKVAEPCPTVCNPMEFSRPEYWSGQPLPSPRNLPNPRIELGSPALQADSLPAEPQGKPNTTGVGRVAYPFSRGLPNSGIEPGSPTLQVNSLPTELLGKPRKILKLTLSPYCFLWTMLAITKVLVQENRHRTGIDFSDAQN